MGSFYNAFSNISETGHSEFHPKKTTLLQKYQATFLAIFSDWRGASYGHVGLFDYFTVGVPGFLLWLAMEALSSKYAFAKFVLFPILLVINIPLLITRFVVSAALFLPLAILVVPFVHLISQAAGGWELREKIAKLPVLKLKYDEPKYEPKKVIGEEESVLKEFLQNEDITDMGCDIDVDVKAKSDQTAPQGRITFYFWRTTHIKDGYNHARYSLTKEELENMDQSSETFQSLKAFAELNLVNIPEKMEYHLDLSKYSEDEQKRLLRQDTANTVLRLLAPSN